MRLGPSSQPRLLLSCPCARGKCSTWGGNLPPATLGWSSNGQTQDGGLGKGPPGAVTSEKWGAGLNVAEWLHRTAGLAVRPLLPAGCPDGGRSNSHGGVGADPLLQTPEPQASAAWQATTPAQHPQSQALPGRGAHCPALPRPHHPCPSRWR